MQQESIFGGSLRSGHACVKKCFPANLKITTLAVDLFLRRSFSTLTSIWLNYLKIGRIVEGTPTAIASKRNTYVMSYDLRNGIPAGDNSLEVIYHCHFLEHLSYDDGYFFLCECFRCLIPRGVMRFALPDMELWCRNYASGNSEFFDWYRQTNLNSHYPNQRNETNGMVFSAAFYNWCHRMAYDYDSLLVRLSQIGFVDIKREAWGDSEAVPQISFLEPADSDYIRESLVVECRKSSVNAENSRK
jgi:predicted SAM-dependent methyltransferase